MQPDTYTISTAAKLIGIGPRKLFCILRAANVIGKNNLPRQRYIDSGHMKIEHKTYTPEGTGITKHYGQPLVTATGINWLKQTITQEQPQ